MLLVLKLAFLGSVQWTTVEFMPTANGLFVRAGGVRRRGRLVERVTDRVGHRSGLAAREASWPPAYGRAASSASRTGFVLRNLTAATRPTEAPVRPACSAANRTQRLFEASVPPQSEDDLETSPRNGRFAS